MSDLLGKLCWDAAFDGSGTNINDEIIVSNKCRRCLSDTAVPPNELFVDAQRTPLHLHFSAFVAFRESVKGCTNDAFVGAHPHDIIVVTNNIRGQIEMEQMTIRYPLVLELFESVLPREIDFVSELHKQLHLSTHHSTTTHLWPLASFRNACKAMLLSFFCRYYPHRGYLWRKVDVVAAAIDGWLALAFGSAFGVWRLEACLMFDVANVDTRAWARLRMPVILNTDSTA